MSSDWKTGRWGPVSLMLFGNEDFAFANVVGGGHDAFLFHLLHKPRGFVVADAELALDVGGIRSATDVTCATKSGQSCSPSQ